MHFLNISEVGNDIANTVPQALVAATVASKAAEQAAWQAVLLSAIVLITLIILGAMFLFMAFQIRELIRHTNDVREELIAYRSTLKAEKKDKT